MLNPPPPVKRIIDTTMNRKTAPQKYIGFQNEKNEKKIDKFRLWNFKKLLQTKQNWCKKYLINSCFSLLIMI